MQLFTCVWWFDFDCDTAEDFYNLNEGLYEAGPDNGVDGGGNGLAGGAGGRPGSSGVRPGGAGGKPGEAGGRPGATGGGPGSSGVRPGSVGGRPGSVGGRPGGAEGLPVSPVISDEDDLTNYGSGPTGAVKPDSLYGAPRGAASGNIVQYQAERLGRQQENQITKQRRRGGRRGGRRN